MASNKNPVRKTHEGYINSKNISQAKNSQRSEEENHQHLKNGMAKLISQGNQQI